MGEMAFLKRIAVLVIIFKICAVDNELTECDYNKSHKWQVVGIYSACYNQSNRSKLNRLAENLDKTVEYMWEKRATDLFKRSGDYSFKINVTYISIDVCTDFNRFSKTIESIYLDRRFNYDAISKRSNTTLSVSRIIAIYAEGPPEMMTFLDMAFYGDVRFAGKYVSFNSSIDAEHYTIYADILYYVITHRLKWEKLLMLNVQPSSMSALYKLLTQKAINSKLCIQYLTVQSGWSISSDGYFTPKWFKENIPAVITIGDKYGQVQIVKELTKLMETENITIPILAEGFTNIIRGRQKAPENFDCFEGLSSSFLTTTSKIFSRIGDQDYNLRYISLLREISNTINITISNIQREAFAITLKLDILVTGEHRCQCFLDHDCMKEMIRIHTRTSFKQTYVYSLLHHTRNNDMGEILIMDHELPPKAPKWTGQCRILRQRKQYHKTSWQDHAFHTDDCIFESSSERCWKGELRNICISTYFLNGFYLNKRTTSSLNVVKAFNDLFFSMKI